MKLIRSSYKIIPQKPGLEGIYEQIELAGRTCYKSEPVKRISSKDFVDKLIKRKHTSVLEHGAVYLKFPVDYPDELDDRGDIISTVCTSPYSKYCKDEDYWYISTNYRVIVDNEAKFMLDYLCEPTEHHEKRITVRFTTSNSIMREFTRHRSHSFSVESTRYCNYSKDKFNNEITFIEPSWYDRESPALKEALLISGLGEAEKHYLALIEAGAKPQEAREVLPLATKCDMIMSAYVSDWEHLFRLRTSFIAETGKPHPDMSNLCDPLYEEFISKGLIK